MQFLSKFLLFACLWYSVPSLAQNNFGAGIVIGDPTGLTAKYNLSSENAIDAALSFGRGSNYYLHGTWLWQKSRLGAVNRYPINWYFGLGARLISHDHSYDHHHGPFGLDHRDDDVHKDDFHAAIRGPLGLRILFTDPRIELFGELSFAMDIIPEMDFDLDFGIGARYYF